MVGHASLHCWYIYHSLPVARVLLGHLCVYVWGCIFLGNYHLLKALLALFRIWKKKKTTRAVTNKDPYWCYIVWGVQLVRQLQGQDENPFGDEESTSTKKIFQLLNQVRFSYNYDVCVFLKIPTNLFMHENWKDVSHYSRIQYVHLLG